MSLIDGHYSSSTNQAAIWTVWYGGMILQSMLLVLPVEDAQRGKCTSTWTENVPGSLGGQGQAVPVDPTTLNHERSPEAPSEVKLIEKFPSSSSTQERQVHKVPRQRSRTDVLPKEAIFLIVQALVYLILLDSTDIFSSKARPITVRAAQVLAFLSDFPIYSKLPPLSNLRSPREKNPTNNLKI
ncbi:hypothetical protein MRB53_001414 [Persea americana]|uniref:Uncharacterized protein n=1 Tax=Persea americana TaxID=3435 RepID=A0ACC2MRR8_PERAE|nr:hypothetical protein MRB53_001414 [Persea americana]